MIQAAIAALILLGIYKFIDRKREPEEFDPIVDWWMAALFIFAPSILIFLISIVLGALGVARSFALLGYLLYFIVPYCMLAFSLGFTKRRAFSYSIWVPFVAILTEIPFVLLVIPQNL